MSKLSITGPVNVRGCPTILPGETVRFAVTANSEDPANPGGTELYVSVTCDGVSSGMGFQSPWPSGPQYFDITAPSHNFDVRFRSPLEYLGNGEYTWEDHDYTVPVDTTTKPAFGGFNRTVNCDLLTYAVSVEVARGDSWSYRLLDGSGNVVDGGTPNAPSTSGCSFVATVSDIPSAADRIEFTATNPNGSTTVTYELGFPTPNVVGFVSDPAEIAPGSAATLQWSVEGSFSAEIDPGVGLVWEGDGGTSASGSVQVAPTETTTYTLTARGPCSNATAQATVTVVSPQTYHAILTSTIPANWRINKAVLVLKAKPSDDPTVNKGLLTMRIYGGPAFIGQRPRRITDARVEWRLAGWTADEWYESPDISCVLAEMRAKGFTTIYLSPCSGSSWYQAYDSGDGTSPKLQVWASTVRSHVSTGGLAWGGSAEVRRPQSSLILNRFTISSVPDVREPTACLILNRFAVHTETREPAESLILNRFAVGTETRTPTASLILNRFGVRARQSSLILNRFAVRSQQSALILNRFAVFYPDRHHVVCRNLATGEVRELGVVDADASPLQLADVALAPGTYEVWIEREGLYWKVARKPTVQTIAITDGPPILNPLPVALDLAATVSRGQTTITWIASHAVAGWETRWGLWFAAASPVDTSGPPAQRVAAMPTQLTYEATRRQAAAEYVAVVAIAADGQRGLQAELHLPWSTTPPVSPPNQTAMAGWPRAT